MKRVVGVGGIFFKSKDPKALYEWYHQHLGIESEPGAGAMWSGGEITNVWAIFPQDTKYLGSGPSPFMINYRVENLKELRETLRAEGVEVDDKFQEHEYGKFGWITDPEGNRVELWEPPPPEK